MPTSTATSTAIATATTTVTATPMPDPSDALIDPAIDHDDPDVLLSTPPVPLPAPPAPALALAAEEADLLASIAIGVVSSEHELDERSGAEASGAARRRRGAATAAGAGDENATPGKRAAKRKDRGPHLTAHNWLTVYDFTDKHPGMGQMAVVKHFSSLGVNPLIFNQATLSRKLKPDVRAEVEKRASTGTVGSSSKRARIVTRPDVEMALVKWQNEMVQKGEAVSGERLKEKYKTFEDLFEVPEAERLKVSNGWLNSFRAMHSGSSTNGSAKKRKRDDGPSHADDPEAAFLFAVQQATNKGASPSDEEIADQVRKELAASSLQLPQLTDVDATGIIDDEEDADGASDTSLMNLTHLDTTTEDAHRYSPLDMSPTSILSMTKRLEAYCGSRRFDRVYNDAFIQLKRMKSALKREYPSLVHNNIQRNNHHPTTPPSHSTIAMLTEDEHHLLHPHLHEHANNNEEEEEQNGRGEDDEMVIMNDVVVTGHHQDVVSESEAIAPAQFFTESEPATTTTTTTIIPMVS